MSTVFQVNGLTDALEWMIGCSIKKHTLDISGYASAIVCNPKKRMLVCDDPLRKRYKQDLNST